jgi:hypothetical protein
MLGNGQTPKTSSGGVKGVSTDYAHHELHIGNHYTAADVATLNLAETSEFIIRTPNVAELAHLLNNHRSQGEAKMEIFRAPTLTDDGTPITINNRNDNFNGSSSGVSIFVGPTISSDGTALPGFDQHFGSGQNIPGETRSINEIVLLPDTDYLIRLTSESNNNEINCSFDFYMSDDAY